MHACVHALALALALALLSIYRMVLVLALALALCGFDLSVSSPWHFTFEKKSISFTNWIADMNNLPVRES